MPAYAEIILEGEVTEGDVHTEGPFGEFTGYYASPSSDQGVIRVRRVYYRNDPILTMATPMRPPSDMSFGRSIVKSGMIWDAIERAGISGVQGVWCHEAGAMRLFNVISVKQAYAGHAKQVGLVAAGCQAAAPISGASSWSWTMMWTRADLFDVVWAIHEVGDPALDIEVIRRMWSGPLDPPFRTARRELPVRAD